MSKRQPDTCIIATSWKFQDALSVAPYAYWKKAPIYLCDDGSNKLSAETEKAIKAGGYKSAIIVGGPIAVDSGVEARLENCGIPSVKRIYGETEYETSAAIADWETKCGMSVDVYKRQRLIQEHRSRSEPQRPAQERT